MPAHGLDALLYHLDVPLVAPFDTATGRVEARSVGLVSVSRDGLTGWGEAAPYPGQDEPFSDVLEAASTYGMTPTLAAAIDEAICDLVARERRESISDELGPTRAKVPISVAIGMGPNAVAATQRAADAGIGSVKVKIEPGETAHVAEIRERFPGLAVAVDANGSFDPSMIDELVALADLGVAYVEQPFHGLETGGIGALADAGVAVFLDESVRSASDAADALAVAGVAGIVVKPGRLGWQTSVNAVKMARAAGKRWKASGLLETGVGRAYTLALAAAEDASMSDIAPAEWFMTFDPSPFLIDGSSIVVSDAPGSGASVDAHEVRRRSVATISLSGSVVRGLD